MLQPHGKYERAAIHEAGHCALIVENGDLIGSVALLRNGAETLHVLRHRPTTDSLLTLWCDERPQVVCFWLMKEAALACGGAMAEHRLLGRPFEVQGADLAAYEAVGNAFPPTDAHQRMRANVLDGARRGVEAIIRKREAAIRALAAALVEKRTLTGEEAMAFFQQEVPPTPATDARHSSAQPHQDATGD